MSDALNKLSTELTVNPIVVTQSEFSELAVTMGFLDLIKKLFDGIDLSGMTKAEFLAAVSTAFDTFIAPMLSTSPFGMILTPMLKALAMGMASRFYDNHSSLSLI
jgi:hypothetical protein